ncbi:MAG: baseplate J/gp47 family protein [Chloroflexi bacterium]|nr:baseplate J/gp47 family protein [Chloroflexota bacterium]
MNPSVALPPRASEVDGAAAETAPTPPARRWEQVLTFTDNESIASILLKLDALSVREIAIVTRPALPVFRNPVAMRLLQHKAQDLGLDVSIISADPMTQALCDELGFSIYNSPDAFRRETIRRGFLDTGALKLRRPAGSWVSYAVCLALAGLIAFVTMAVLPAASISLVPGVKTLALDVPVTVSDGVGGADPAAQTIPGRIAVAEVDGSSLVRATGLRDAPNAAAKGFVIFTNEGPAPVTVPTGTRLLAGSLAFTTTQDATVSQAFTYGDRTSAGTSVVAVQAADPGEQGNVPAGAITAIDGALSGRLSVINRTALIGGSKQQVGYLTADDQTKARESLRLALTDQALQKLHSELAAGDSFVPDANSQTDAGIESATFDLSPDQVSSQTTLHMKVMVKGLTFHNDDVNQVAAAAISQAMRQDGPGARLQDGSPLTVSPPVVLAGDGSTLKLQVHAAGSVVAPIDAAGVPERVKGLSPDKAQAILQSLPGVAQADVQLWPAWAKKVPSFSWRIHVSTTGAATG